MKTQIYKYAIALLAVSLIGTSYALLNNQMYSSIAAGTPQQMGYTGMVCREVTRTDGTVLDLGCYHNVLANNGKNLTTSQLFSKPSAASATDVVDTMQLGNTSAPLVTSATHPGLIAECGLDEYASLAWIGVGTATDGNGNVSTNYRWTSTCDGVVVNTTGLLSNTNKYFAGNTFTSVTLQANDQLNVTWYVWIT
jgi:hypothetical protein